MTFLSYINKTSKPKSEALQNAIKFLPSIDNERIDVVVNSV